MTTYISHATYIDRLAHCLAMQQDYLRMAIEASLEGRNGNNVAQERDYLRSRAAAYGDEASYLRDRIALVGPDAHD